MISSYAFRTLHRRAGLSVTAAIGDGMHRSPLLGYVVRWSRRWRPDQAEGQLVEPACETLRLRRDDGKASVTLVCADRREMLDAADTVRYWRSAFYLGEFMEPGTMVLFSDHNRSGGVVLLAEPDKGNGDLMVTLKETFTTSHRTSARVTLTAPFVGFVETFIQARESLRVDGRPMIPVMSEDILRAILQ